MMRTTWFRTAFAAALALGASTSYAQSVGLPAPRLLTTMPMGGQVGTEFEVAITGEYLDDAADLTFSDSHLTATLKRSAAGR